MAVDFSALMLFTLILESLEGEGFDAEFLELPLVKEIHAKLEGIDYTDEIEEVCTKALVDVIVDNTVELAKSLGIEIEEGIREEMMDAVYNFGMSSD